MQNISKTLVSFVLIGVASASLLAQSTKMGKDFLVDVNRPFVYVMFDHIGPGIPRDPTEPNSRIWLRLKNNCRIAILVRANGVPDESPKDEVGLEWKVVPNPTIQGMVSFSPSGKDKPQTGLNAETQKSEKTTDEIPRGYMEEVASLVTIGPGQQILFSMPVNHLSERWHVEIPFDFELSPTKGPLNSNTVGLPIMAVMYTVWDLPRNSQAEVLRK
jgi:hypothetical protein